MDAVPFAMREAFVSPNLNVGDTTPAYGHLGDAMICGVSCLPAGAMSETLVDPKGSRCPTKGSRGATDGQHAWNIRAHTHIYSSSTRSPRGPLEVPRIPKQILISSRTLGRCCPPAPWSGNVPKRDIPTCLPGAPPRKHGDEVLRRSAPWSHEGRPGGAQRRSR